MVEAVAGRAVGGVGGEVGEFERVGFQIEELDLPGLRVAGELPARVNAPGYTMLVPTFFNTQAEAATTASAVMPSSFITVLPGALMPKRSMPRTLPCVPTYFHQRPETPASMAMR